MRKYQGCYPCPLIVRRPVRSPLFLQGPRRKLCLRGAMAKSLRPTGLSVLGDVPWGGHFCLFYETQQDLLDTLVPYFKTGLESNEFCVWAVTDPLTEEEAKAALQRAMPDLQRYLSAGSLEIVQGFDWYLSQDLKKITSNWNEKLENALAKGYEGMRASGNAFWLGTEYRDDFLAYEQELDESLAGRKMLVLCTYPLDTAVSADVLDVARAHQVTAARRHGSWEFIEAADTPTTHSLTLREVQVLTWVARGKSAWEIGKILDIAKRTVDEHVGSAIKKLGAANRTEATALALRGHIIELDSVEGPARKR
jgi:DNA-binding CsgD family transcriptional regulator